jgi:tellurite resistance protein TerC
MTFASPETAHGFLDLNVQWWEWALLVVVSMTGIGVDLYVNRGHRVPAFKRAVRMVLSFVAVGVGYGVFIMLMHGGDAGWLYFAAWGTEYSLSIDNMFIMVVIYDTFKVPAKYRHKLLFLGVFGALVFRFAFILVGSLLLDNFRPFVTPVLALMVGFAVYKVWKDDTEDEVEESGPYKLAKRFLPIKEGRNFGARLFIVEKIDVVIDGLTQVKTKVWVTYLMVCLVVTELMDLLFAVDSVPAALAITSVTYLVYSSNAMAILGLRALYFVIGPLKEKMSWLNEGLAVILGWVALKLLLGWEFAIGSFHWGPVWHPPIWVSPVIIAAVLAVAVVASLKWPKKEGGEGKSEPPIFHAAMVIHGGGSYRRELADGLLQRIYTEALEVTAGYDTDGIVPLIVARDEPFWAGSVSAGDSRTVNDLLGSEVHGEVNLAAAVREALSHLPEDEPGLVVVISDFQIADEKALTALVDELAYSGRQVFQKLVFATSDEDGNYNLPQMLDDRHKGIRDKVDAVYATHNKGVPGESVAEHFGRELDDLARVIRRTAKEGNSTPSPVG